MSGVAAVVLMAVLLVLFILGVAATADLEPCWPDCPTQEQTP